MTDKQEICAALDAATTLLAPARRDGSRPFTGAREDAAIRACSTGIQHGATPGTHSILDLMVIEQRSCAIRGALEFAAIVLAVPVLGFAVFACGGAL